MVPPGRHAAGAADPQAARASMGISGRSPISAPRATRVEMRSWPQGRGARMLSAFPTTPAPGAIHARWHRACPAWSVLRVWVVLQDHVVAGHSIAEVYTSA